MINWPRFLEVGGIPFELVEASPSRVVEVSGDENAVGVFDGTNFEVLYSTELSGPFKDVIIFHEIFHMLEQILFAGHVDLGEKEVQSLALAFRQITEQLLEEKDSVE